MTAGSPAPTPVDGRVDLDRLAALEEERDFLLRSLADLEEEWAAGDLDAGDYETLRDGYTHRAAEVIRVLEHGMSSLRAAPRLPVWRRIVVVAVVVAVGAGLGVAVARSAGDRGPGETVTGSVRETSVELLAEARLLVRQGDAVGAIQRLDDVLGLDPDNREAHTYRGWLLVLAGLVDDGAADLDRAVAIDPDYPDARFFRAFVRHRELDDSEGALEDLRHLFTLDPPPDMVPAATDLLAEVEDALEIADDSPSAPSSTRED